MKHRSVGGFKGSGFQGLGLGARVILKQAPTHDAGGDDPEPQGLKPSWIRMSNSQPYPAGDLFSLCIRRS